MRRLLRLRKYFNGVIRVALWPVSIKSQSKFAYSYENCGFCRSYEGNNLLVFRLLQQETGVEKSYSNHQDNYHRAPFM